MTGLALNPDEDSKLQSKAGWRLSLYLATSVYLMSRYISVPVRVYPT